LTIVLSIGIRPIVSTKKAKAYWQVAKALKSGRLKGPDLAVCEECGSTKAIKHHDNYSAPLSVMYLCRKCHVQRHKNVLKWGRVGRTGGGRPGTGAGNKKWRLDFSVLPIGGFVFVSEPMHRISSYVNVWKARNFPTSKFKTFSFQDGTIVFRTR
jgi:hypothetical protein